MIKYQKSEEIAKRVTEIARKIGIDHDFSRVICVESSGSRSRRTLARCHALPRIMQAALGTKAHYVIEIIRENFFVLPKEEQDKTLIHELLHIPKAFGGGFKGHAHANKRAVDRLYDLYRNFR